MPNRSALIIGSGLAGCLLARLLACDGWSVRMIERRNDPRAKGYQGGRSINLALSARGLWGLAAADLDTQVLAQDAIAMPGRMMHSRNGDLTYQPYSADSKNAINSVSRGGLNITLLNAAQAAGATCIFGTPCLDVDLQRETVSFQDADGEVMRESADLIIGADGAFSPLRLAMQKTDRFELHQTYLGHGYKELRIPSAAELRTAGVVTPEKFAPFAFDPHALHIWPRGGSMMIALPNRDGSFTCTLFWPYSGDHSFESLSADDVRSFFETHYGDAAHVMPHLEEEYTANPVGSLVTVRCAPWTYGGRFVILGDAAHAIVPFYGQGMNAAFEDCRTLADLLRSRGQAEALKEFALLRKPNADAIAQMALANFTEMRDHVGNADFLYKKKIEQELYRIDPAAYTPQYDLVSFSCHPVTYVDALRRGGELTSLYESLIALVPRSHGLDPVAWSAAVRTALERVLRDDNPTKSTTHHVPRVVADLSPTLSVRTHVWPGDTPLTREVLCDLRSGHTVTLSTLRTTVHIGTHADGENHYVRDGRSIAEHPLEHYIGPCTVVSCIGVTAGLRIGESNLCLPLASLTTPRVLIRTGTFASGNGWKSDFAGLDPLLIDALAGRGVTTIGVDTPSVDTQESKDLPAHAACARARISIIEGLDLGGVRDGEYFLSAAPLKLEGFDASPVRAVLLERPPR